MIWVCDGSMLREMFFLFFVYSGGEGSLCLSMRCDLFWDGETYVKRDPFKRLSDLQLRNQKGRSLNHLVSFVKSLSL